MSPAPVRLRRAALAGAALGAAHFAADLASSLLAIGDLMDRSAGQAALLALAAGSSCAFGAAIGMVLAAAWPRRWHPGRRLFAALVAALLLATVVGGYALRRGRRPEALGAPPATAAPGARSILLVVIDTLRADTLYGADLSFPLTPGLGAIARGAVVFTEAEANASWTIPSVASLMTGMLPERLDSRRARLPDWAPTLAARLRAAGYETSAFVDNALVERRNGFTAGFSTYFQRSAQRFAFSLAAYRLIPDVIQHAVRARLRVFELGAERLTTAAVHMLAAPRAAPLFVYVHYMDPHEPYYRQPGVPDPPGCTPVDTATLPGRVRARPAAAPSAAELCFIRHRYEGEIRAVDAPVSRLVAAFRRRYGDAGIVAVVSDHGEELMDHGELGHGGSLFRELVRVPAIVDLGDALPATRRAQRVDAPMSLVDLAPTLLDAAGVPSSEADGEMDGASWLSFLRGAAPAPGAALFAATGKFDRIIFRWREGPRVLVITHRYTSGAETRERALFDHQRDPDERHDLAAVLPEVADALEARFQASSDDQRRRRGRSRSPGGADPETLHALGYVQ